MRGIALIAAAIVAIVAGGPSLADTVQEGEAVQVARTYWHGDPACGVPTIAWHELEGLEVGLFSWGTCTITLDPQSTTAEVGLECRTIVHEWGHGVLGPTYFASTNPLDPAHSPDPRSIMNAVIPLAFRPCEPVARREVLRYVIPRHCPGDRRCRRWKREL